MHDVGRSYNFWKCKLSHIKFVLFSKNFRASAKTQPYTNLKSHFSLYFINGKLNSHLIQNLLLHLQYLLSHITYGVHLRDDKLYVCVVHYLFLFWNLWPELKIFKTTKKDNSVFTYFLNYMYSFQEFQEKTKRIANGDSPDQGQLEWLTDISSSKNGETGGRLFFQAKTTRELWAANSPSKRRRE